MTTDRVPDPNPWVPITDLVDAKHLGKLAEESGELTSAIARCQIQGLRNGEAHPITGKPNQEWLEDEIADVLANINLVVARFNLDANRMLHRTEKKMSYLRVWHSMAHMKPYDSTE